MSVTRYGWRWTDTPYSGDRQVLDEKTNGEFVHYSDYEKLVKALRQIRRDPTFNQEIAEAALLSAGETL